jgi:hypothetical protein
MLQIIQKWIESTYCLEQEQPVSQFLIKQTLLKKYLGNQHPLNHAEEVLLVFAQNEEVELGLYLHPKFSRKMDFYNSSPHEILTLLEGVSHLRLALNRFRVGENFSQLEMELQAEIDKFLFFSMPHDLFPNRNAWAHLEKEANLRGLSKQQKETYQTARRLACRYCLELEKKYLNTKSFDGLFHEVRQFYRMSHWKKIHTIGLP